MLNLYWKIFLAFWLSSALVIGGAFWIAHQVPLEGKEDERPTHRKILRDLRDLRNQGPLPSQRWLKTMEEKYQLKSYEFALPSKKRRHRRVGPITPLFDRQLLALSNEDIYQLRGRLGDRQFRIVRDDKLYFLVRGFNRDKPSLLVIELPAPRSRMHQLFLESMMLRFGIALVLSALICFALARYFTVPISKLRAAMARVAEGDYRVRAADSPAGRDELKLLAEDFDSMTQKVQASLDSRARLIQDVSHELRSPLARMQAALGLLEQKNPELYNSDTLGGPEWQLIQREIHTLDELIEQILSLPQSALEMTDAVDLHGVLKHCLDTLQELASEKSVALELRSDVEEAIVATHGRLLISVFDNILQNALRYAPNDSSVGVSLRQIQNCYEIEITDSGGGVDHDHLAKLFDPFYRASSSRSRDSGGYGLGMAIAQRHIELHDGTISARNVVNEAKQRGLAVRITLQIPPAPKS